jgi:hypothetical protein
MFAWATCPHTLTRDRNDTRSMLQNATQTMEKNDVSMAARGKRGGREHTGAGRHAGNKAEGVRVWLTWEGEGGERGGGEGVSWWRWRVPMVQEPALQVFDVRGHKAAVVGLQAQAKHKPQIGAGKRAHPPLLTHTA